MNSRGAASPGSDRLPKARRPAAVGVETGCVLRLYGFLRGCIAQKPLARMAATAPAILSWCRDNMARDEASSRQEFPWAGRSFFESRLRHLICSGPSGLGRRLHPHGGGGACNCSLWTIAVLEG